MSYTIKLDCGCTVYVACDPKTGLSHTRMLELKGLGCRVRNHETGRKLYLWELLPQPSTPPTIRCDTA